MKLRASTSPARSSFLIWSMRLRAASAALALAVVLLLVVVATQSARAQIYEVLHTFHGEADGAFPVAGLVRDAAGNLYGTSSGNGLYGSGVVFRLSPAGSEFTVLYTFTGGADGAFPGGVVRDAEGNLYGTTGSGGTYGNGVVFELDTAGRETVLHSFTGGADGVAPSGVVLDVAAGNLYGTTFVGGTYGRGVVFELSLATGKETVLYAFTGGADGANPFADLILDAAGNLYGTASEGGDFYGNGVVFKLSPTTRKQTVLYTFPGGADGAGPSSRLVLRGAGDLYGTTSAGGNPSCTFGCGVVFKVDTTGHETVLYSFTGGADGGKPEAGVLLDNSGNIFGTTYSGGTFSGVVFELDATAHETVLHNFTGGGDGWGPRARVVRDEDGNLYGTAPYGGDLNCGGVYFGCGVVFKLTP
jgi:uncharacterized repeat protein (TIGR03803 family)